MVDLFYPLGFQKSRRFLAADTAGAEHGEFCFASSQFSAMCTKPFGEFGERLSPRIDSAFEGTNRHFVIVAGVNQNGFGVGYQSIPVFRLDIGANFTFWVDTFNAQSHDLFL